MIHPPASIVPPALASHLLQKVQQGISPVELVYATHERWPFLPGQIIHPRSTLRLSVLDSSFNPPTLAHLALVNSLPQPDGSSQRPDAISAPAESYDARMLLLSVRNADKVLKPGDATLVQRLDMMRLLSCDVRATNPARSGSEPPQIGGNIAVAIINEPTFVGKSAVLLRFLRTRLATVAQSFDPPNRTSGKRDALCPLPEPKLTFLLGIDTLVRLFSPTYYPSERAMAQMLRAFLSPDLEDCRIVCANRRSANTDKTSQETQDQWFGVAHEFIASGHIAFINIGAEEQTYSSTEVRAKVVARDESWKRLVTGTVANYIIKEGLYSSSEGEQ